MIVYFYIKYGYIQRLRWKYIFRHVDLILFKIFYLKKKNEKIQLQNSFLQYDECYLKKWKIIQTIINFKYTVLYSIISYNNIINLYERINLEYDHFCYESHDR